MTLYSVFDHAARPLAAPAVVPEKFSWFAALLPPVFLVAHGLWLVLLAYLVGVVGLGFLSAYIGSEAGFWIYGLGALCIGFEAAALRRGALSRRGWAYRTELIAPAADAAQVAFLQRRSPAA